MKNLIAMMLALVLAVTLPLTALAEATEGMSDPYAAELHGLVTGWNEDGSILIRGEYGEMYQVNLSDETSMEDAQFLALGDYVTVLYDGRLSRSIPAQLTASYISCFKRTGEVLTVEVDEENGVLLGFTMADGEEQLYVNMEGVDTDAGVYVGSTVTVYFTGMMSRSIPAQISALYVRCIDLAGQLLEISEVDEDGVYSILVNDEAKGEVLVWCSADTILYTELNVGEMITVATNGMMTMSLPAQTTALEVFSMAVPAL